MNCVSYTKGDNLEVRIFILFEGFAEIEPCATDPHLSADDSKTINSDRSVWTQFLSYFKCFHHRHVTIRHFNKFVKKFKVEYIGDTLEIVLGLRPDE